MYISYHFEIWKSLSNLWRHKQSHSILTKTPEEKRQRNNSTVMEGEEGEMSTVTWEVTMADLKLTLDGITIRLASMATKADITQIEDKVTAQNIEIQQLKTRMTTLTEENKNCREPAPAPGMLAWSRWLTPLHTSATRARYWPMKRRQKLSEDGDLCWHCEYGYKETATRLTTSTRWNNDIWICNNCKNDHFNPHIFSGMRARSSNWNKPEMDVRRCSPPNVRTAGQSKLS